MQSIRWDGSERGFEYDLCTWRHIGSLALSLCAGRYVRVPTREGAELLFPGDWLVRAEDGSIHVRRGTA